MKGDIVTEAVIDEKSLIIEVTMSNTLKVYLNKDKELTSRQLFFYLIVEMVLSGNTAELDKLVSDYVNQSKAEITQVSIH